MEGNAKSSGDVAEITGQLETTHLEEKGKVETRLTGITYDPRMALHKNEVDTSHPECPERITSIWKLLESKGYVERCVRIQSRDATKEEVLYVHSEAHWDKLSQLPSLTDEELVIKAYQYNSIFFNKGTFSSGTISAGSVIELTEAVVTGKVRNGLSVNRPPGHHCEKDQPMGFCIFNNVPIAIRHAQKKFGVKKVLVVDWDVHHGQATQHMFYDDPSVLYFSVHRFDYGFFYPGLKDGNYTFSGEGDGKGFNINVPWNKSGMGDGDYLAVFNHLLLPVAYEFDPDLVMISCGLDAARGDPLGNCSITPSGYAHMTHLLMGLAGGRVVVALEGGYNLTSISNSMAAIAGALLGDPLPPLEGPPIPCQSALVSIQDAIAEHLPFWNGLVPLDLTQERKCKQQPPPAAAKVSSAPSKEEEEEAEVTEHDVAQENEGPNLGAVAVGPQGLRVPVELTGQNRLVVGELENAGHTTMFAVTPRAHCDHTDGGLKPVPAEGLDAKKPCLECGHVGENWVCLECYEVHCSRYVNKHMVQHNEESHHPLALSFSDLSVWCYSCDDYIHNADFDEVHRAAHLAKFGCLPGQN